MSQYRMAKLTRLHASTISLVERGARSPSLFVLIKMASSMGVSLGSIISEVETAELDSASSDGTACDSGPDESSQRRGGSQEPQLESAFHD